MGGTTQGKNKETSTGNKNYDVDPLTQENCNSSAEWTHDTDAATVGSPQSRSTRSLSSSSSPSAEEVRRFGAWLGSPNAHKTRQWNTKGVAKPVLPDLED